MSSHEGMLEALEGQRLAVILKEHLANRFATVRARVESETGREPEHPS